MKITLEFTAPNKDTDEIPVTIREILNFLGETFGVIQNLKIEFFES